MHRGSSQERVECAASHFCCCSGHTGDMLGWDILKFPPRTSVIYVPRTERQSAPKTQILDLNGLVFFCFFVFIGSKRWNESSNTFIGLLVSELRISSIFIKDFIQTETLPCKHYLLSGCVTSGVFLYFSQIPHWLKRKELVDE